MHSVYVAFRECGWASWLCLLIGFAGVAAGLVGVVLLAAKASRAAFIVGALAIVLGVSSMGVGVLGREIGLSKMDRALSGASIDPEMKERIRVVGTEEANQCIKVGGALGALPLALGVVAVLIGLAVQKQ